MVYALLSPAKTMQFEAGLDLLEHATPHFQKEAMQLVKVLQGYDEKGLMKLMGISAPLAKLNADRFKDFVAKPGVKATQAPAILAYRGDVYQGLAATDLTEKQLEVAHKHLGIISGLYGLLQPLDLIQPYRLEMSTTVSSPKFKNLYAFWGDAITDRVNELAKKAKAKAVIGLASQEYQKAVDKNKLDLPFIHCDFKEEKAGKFATVGLFAKQARGLMARYIVTQKITNPDDLKKFAESGYTFHKSLSDDSNIVFTRKASKK
ncbi:MAG TPA: peroxide stress protein YaaA [Alphaproteobacteria bacterium]